MKFLTTTISLLLVSVTTFSQVNQKFKIVDLAFMTGDWKTTSGWGDMDETWSSPRGNCMMCTFRCVKDGKIVFYEFIVIEQNENDSVPVLKLRHFNPGSIGWEDKDKPYLYPLTLLNGQKAIFERPDKKTIITYERLSKDTLKSVLIQETGEKQKTTEFIYSSSEK
ncbi:MAG TPA: DUF6265 family protein [Chryseolinea sp.]|nr:DUF6265 family protein [Chryseolinea sp.]